ncbi:hypothetical protein [Deinococcus cellulosilyticus]|uniref:Uncharacterized protein n=1 Tax=Deinococcus cellulosilyticus (strain DSM 18568 / NBRC 106333 / KACC 11606 / 5516J-15) TaxID=1223518 RepID=A0A511N2W1_DEIC1|nr:hypothetical protein [Deinococcus cellulosilyticus]GEM47183.1 hypothetical protein DC3_28180 [Deinococcus cellulosilyticus NBRC 106333 = KACC 11606]
MTWAIGVIFFFIAFGIVGIWICCLETQEQAITPEQYAQLPDQDRMDQLERWR